MFIKFLGNFYKAHLIFLYFYKSNYLNNFFIIVTCLNLLTIIKNYIGKYIKKIIQNLFLLMKGKLWNKRNKNLQTK